jgi:hypothetical protein
VQPDTQWGSKQMAALREQHAALHV